MIAPEATMQDRQGMFHRMRRKMEDMLFGIPFRSLPSLIPGVFLAFLIWYFSEGLSNFIGKSLMGFKSSPISTIMLTIIIGLLVRNLIGLPSTLVPGTSFCLKKLLRLGIILLGIRLSFFDVLKIEAIGIPIVLICIATGLIASTYATRLLRLPGRLGTLIAVGTGICGASAIVAAAPAIDATDEEVTYAVANITLFGIMAMFLYPYFADILFTGNQILAGLFLGTSIHETAQVAGGGIMYDQYLASKSVAALATAWGASAPHGSDVAIVTKLTRNAFIAMVIPIMAFYYAKKNSHPGQRVRFSRKYFPFFILGFLFLAGFRTVGEMTLGGPGRMALGAMDQAQWKYLVEQAGNLGGIFLAVAMAGVGLGTSFRNLKTLGIKPFFIGILTAFAVGVVSLTATFLLGPYIKF